jgi:hypothetical protein
VTNNDAYQHRENNEELTPGINRYWLANRKIVVHEATAAYREVVDAWVDSVTNVMAEWPHDRPYLALHDFRAQNLVFTPYARKRSHLLMSIEPPVPGFAAIVIQMSIVGYAVQWFMRSTKSARGMTNRLFFDYDEAVKWLLSHSDILAPKA